MRSQDLSQIKMYQYLRSNVVRSAAKSFGGPIAGNALLAHTKIGDLDVTILIQQNVVQFQVAIDDAARVKVEQSDCDFGRVKSVQMKKKSNWYKIIQ